MPPSNQARRETAARMAEEFPCIVCGNPQTERVGVY